MANPIFRKSGTSDVVLSQAPDLVSASPFAPRQIEQRTYNGNTDVNSKSVEDQLFNITLSELPSTDADALVVFFQSSVVDFKRLPFYYIDENSVQRQMRYVVSNLPGVPISPTVRRVTITLRIDRGPFE